MRNFQSYFFFFTCSGAKMPLKPFFSPRKFVYVFCNCTDSFCRRFVLPSLLLAALTLTTLMHFTRISLSPRPLLMYWNSCFLPSSARLAFLKVSGVAGLLVLCSIVCFSMCLVVAAWITDPVLVWLVWADYLLHKRVNSFICLFIIPQWYYSTGSWQNLTVQFSKSSESSKKSFCLLGNTEGHFKVWDLLSDDCRWNVLWCVQTLGKTFLRWKGSQSATILKTWIISSSLARKQGSKHDCILVFKALASSQMWIPSRIFLVCRQDSDWAEETSSLRYKALLFIYLFLCSSCFFSLIWRYANYIFPVYAP